MTDNVRKYCMTISKYGGRFSFFFLFIIEKIFRFRPPYLQECSSYITEVLDVNRFQLFNGRRVRLIGIIPAKNSYQMALELVSELTLGREVILHFDKQQYDEDGYMLAYVLMREDKQIKEISKKYKHFLYFDFEGEEPPDFWIIDTLGNRSINPEAVKNMKPPEILYAEIGVNLLANGLADFKSMPPSTQHDSLYIHYYKKAIEEELGVWKM